MLITFYLTAGRISKATAARPFGRNGTLEAAYLPRLGILAHSGLIVHGELGGVVIDVQDPDAHVASSYLRWVL